MSDPKAAAAPAAKPAAKPTSPATKPTSPATKPTSPAAKAAAKPAASPVPKTGKAAPAKAGRKKKVVPEGKRGRVRKPPVRANAEGKSLKPYQVSTGRPKNYVLTSGLMAYSKSRMFHRKGKWLFVRKTNPSKERPKKQSFVEKSIGGEKNGGTRKVLVQKRPKNYVVGEKTKKQSSRKRRVGQKSHVRKSLKPGTICILVAGPHRGKRVVLLKKLDSGLLLVNGPYKVNGCPMRRVHPNYVIATSSRLDLAGLAFPTHLKDDYFKRARAKKTKKEEGDIFSTKKEKYQPSEQRKKDQKLVDYLTCKAFAKFKDTRLLYRYMASMFSLKSKQYPHRMKF